MIIFKGNRRYIQSISHDFWTVWKGFIQHINHFKKKNNNASDLLRDIDILIGIILEKDTNAVDELREALTGLSSLLHDIRVQITTIDSEFNHLTKTDFVIQKKKLVQLVKQARQNLMLVAADLKNVDFSRRKFIGTTAKGAFSLAVAASFGLSSALLERIARALEEEDEAEVKRIFKSASVPFTNQIKPIIKVQIPSYLEKKFQRAKQDQQLKEELLKSFVESIKALLKRERFTEKESKNAITYLYDQKFLEQKGLVIKNETADSVGTSIFTENVISNALQNKDSTIRGLMLSVYHGFRESSEHHIYFKRKKQIAPSFKFIAYCKEYDLIIYLFVPLFEDVITKTGVRFTTQLKEGDEVYLMRYPTHPNYSKYGSISKGKVLIHSYFNPNMKTVDLTITTLETHGGDSGSPIFNKNGDVVGIHYGSLEYQTTKRQGSIGTFIRSEYVLKLLEETQKFFEKELK